MGLVKFLRRKFRRGKTDETTVICKKNRGELHYLSWDELQRLTMNFSVIIGYGGFSTVYLAQFNDSSTAAVKIYCNTPRLYQAYEQELQILLRLRHDYIVNLLGHCSDRDREEGVLILEYTPNGNLQERLHGSNNLLPWKQRMKIAFQLAQALLYLHENCSPQIVHGDIKASNILLDENLDCKLCDFGSAKVGFCSAVVRMMGSPGYTDPLYLRTGIASKKNDVYSFGVVVLELITGVEAFVPESGERLTARAAPMLREPAKVAEMVDPRLREEIDLEEARAMAELSAKCITHCPTLRPCASHILTTITNSIEMNHRQ
ncbi:hypothetical protein ACS0TY_011237 [Phlomoides rotata]